MKKVVVSIIIALTVFGTSAAFAATAFEIAAAAAQPPATGLFVANSDNTLTIARAPIDVFEALAWFGRVDAILISNIYSRVTNKAPDGFTDDVAVLTNLEFDETAKTVIGDLYHIWQYQSGKASPEALPLREGVKLGSSSSVHGLIVNFPFPVKVGKFGQFHWKEAPVRKDGSGIKPGVVIDPGNDFTFYVNPESTPYLDNGSELTFPVNAGVVGYPETPGGETPGVAKK